MAVRRFGVSLEEGLLESLDKYVREKHFSNRSQAIRHLVKNHLIEKKWEADQQVAGVIVMAYDHHKRDIMTKSTNIQHEFHDVVLATQHFHLNHDYCLETISVKGKASRLMALSDRLISLKGIKDGKLVMSGAD
jgi:CopG family nickel-responsive transcriptional regulator